jgi:hypothetical protein
MKNLLFKSLCILTLLLATGFSVNNETSTKGYDPTLCSLTIASDSGISYEMIKIDRTGNRIKAYYMANSGSDGSIKNRYETFKRTHPNIVAYSAAAYMAKNSYGIYTPEGFTMDHGLLINEQLELTRFDALVINYATGGIAVSDLREDKITADNVEYKIRSNPRDLANFKNWAKTNQATIFQTHLLAKDNTLLVKPANLNKVMYNEQRERRFLIASKDNTSGKVYHYIVNRDKTKPTYLYDGAKDAFNFLQGRGINVTWMINLDVGAQDAFGFNTSDGQPHSRIKGMASLDDALNLLVYYYE